MNPEDFTPGERVYWGHVPGGNYGYTFFVPAVVVSVSKRRVEIRAPLQRGGTKKTWVTSYALTKAEGHDLFGWLEEGEDG